MSMIIALGTEGYGWVDNGQRGHLVEIWINSCKQDFVVYDVIYII